MWGRDVEYVPGPCQPNLLTDQSIYPYQEHSHLPVGGTILQHAFQGGSCHHKQCPSVFRSFVQPPSADPCLCSHQTKVIRRSYIRDRKILAVWSAYKVLLEESLPSLDLSFPVARWHGTPQQFSSVLVPHVTLVIGRCLGHHGLEHTLQFAVDISCSSMQIRQQIIPHTAPVTEFIEIPLQECYRPGLFACLVVYREAKRVYSLVYGEQGQKRSTFLLDEGRLRSQIQESSPCFRQIVCR